MTRLVTTRDIVIPAGSELSPAPDRIFRVGRDTASVLAAVTKDVTMEWTMPMAEALELGLVEERP